MSKEFHTFDTDRVDLWEQVPLRTPFLLSIEPTFACNFRCGYCMHSATPEELKKNRGYLSAPMEWDTFLKTVEQAKAFPDKFKKVTFAGDGEPLLNPRLPEMIRYVREADICDKILVISNGSLLTPELSDKLIDSGLSELKISLQGMTSEKYQEISQVDLDFEKLYQNILYFSEHRKNVVLRVKVADVALDPGEEKLFHDRFESICDDIAIEHIYSQFHDVDFDSQLLPAQGKNRFGYNYEHTDVCGEIFFKISVLRDGMITFGCPDGVTYEGFNVHKMSLWDAWNSKELRTLLYDHLAHRLERHPECIKCTRWDFSVTPHDMLDGHEKEMLEKMPPEEWDFSAEQLRKENIQCYGNEGKA